MDVGRGQRTSAGEAGFTIIEVMVAALLVVVVIVGLLGAFDAVAKSGRVAQRHQQALAVAQREIERLRTLDYNTQLGLTAFPAASATDGVGPGDPTPKAPKNPNFYVVSTPSPALKIMARYQDKTSGLQPGVSPNPEPLVGPGDSKLTDPQVVAGPEPFTAGLVSGVIYRYVTYRSEHCPATTASGISDPCTGRDSKRITVAVLLDAAGDRAGPLKPIWLSSVVGDPNATPTGVAPPTTPPNGPKITAQSLFLYDSACSSTSPGVPSGNHVTHDTSPAPSSSGPVTTCTGATVPDLMGTEVGATSPDPVVPVFDYSSEITRSAPVGLTAQAGLALRRGTINCPTNYPAANASTLKPTVHTWGSVAIPTGGFVIPSGARASVSLWTQTLDGASGRVKFCVALRDAATGAVIGEGKFDQASWPTVPSQLSLAWDLNATTLPAGDRLLLTVSLTADSQKDVLLLYDHPDYESFLSVATTTPLP